MAVARRPVRTRRIATLLVLVSLTLIVVDSAGEDSPLHPARSAARDMASAVDGGLDALWPFGGGGEVDNLRRQNESLQAQLDAANSALATAGDARRDREHLRALLALPTPDGVGKVVADVVRIGGSNFESTIELGKGSDDGIGEGMPVINEAGLIGRVTRTSNDGATVLLIDDPTSNVSIRYTDAGEIGVAAGGGLGRSLSGDLVDIDSAVKVGETAVTSGLDGSIFPPGIPVATVTSSTAGRQDLRRDVELKPTVDFRKLDNVAVLRWKV